MMPSILNCFRAESSSNLINSLDPYGYVSEEPFHFSIRYDVSGGNLSHKMDFLIPETTVGQEDAEALKLRLICHVLVDLISDEALPEVLESLQDNFEFYKERRKASSPLATQEKLKFKLGQKQERPAFQIAQE